MNPASFLFADYAELDEDQAEQLSNPREEFHAVEVKPPWNQDAPESLDWFVRNIREARKKWLVLNASPFIGYEIIRSAPGRLRFQFVVPNRRLEREVKTQLLEKVPDIGFNPGTTALPVTSGDSVGGGIITTGNSDFYPLEAEPDRPVTNTVAAALHPQAMEDTRFTVQILFRAVTGRPFRQWWWRRKAYQNRTYLRGNKVGLISGRERTASPREKNLASAIEAKVDNPRFYAAIRVVVIGAEDYTISRLREVADAFNSLTSDDSRQSLKTVPVRSVFPSRVTALAEAVHRRRFDGYGLPFQVASSELAALTALPSIDQENIDYN